jgi:hypothetical protein
MHSRIKEAQNLEQNALGNKLPISNRATSVAVTVWCAALLILNVDSADLYTEALNSEFIRRSIFLINSYWQHLFTDNVAA